MPYASVQDLRDEGVTITQLSDERAATLLQRASSHIDAVTGQWFEPRTKTLRFDGTGAELLWLAVPLISLTSCSLAGDPLVPGDVVIYGAPGTEERRNPKLARVLKNVWTEGPQNVEIVGSWGFVEADLSTPWEIREACLRLVIRAIPLLSAESTATMDVKKETTDGHSYERFDRTSSTAGAWRFGGLTGDPAIDTVLARFRRPIAGGCP